MHDLQRHLAPIPADVIQWYRNLGLELLEGYGMTETQRVTALPLADAARKADQKRQQDKGLFHGDTFRAAFVKRGLCPYSPPIPQIQGQPVLHFDPATSQGRTRIARDTVITTTPTRRAGT